MNALNLEVGDTIALRPGTYRTTKLEDVYLNPNDWLEITRMLGKSTFLCTKDKDEEDFVEVIANIRDVYNCHSML